MFCVGESPDEDPDSGSSSKIFGDFDPDDPDFQDNFVDKENFEGNSCARPKSRLSGSGRCTRNSSSSSLKRINSSNSIGRQMSNTLRHQYSFERLRPNFRSSDHLASFFLGEEGDAEGVQPITTQANTLVEVQVEAQQCQGCGALWKFDQFSLDCNECGGSAMRKECIKCGGECGNMWKRDVVASHIYSKASWNGCCGLSESLQSNVDEQVSQGTSDQRLLEQVARRLQQM